MADPRFDYYEVVRVSDAGTDAEVAGCEGTVMGRSQDEDRAWHYALQIFKSGEVWDLPEVVLTSTGRVMRRTDFYDGASAGVIVNPETGEGNLSERDGGAA